MCKMEQKACSLWDANLNTEAKDIPVNKYAFNQHLTYLPGLKINSLTDNNEKIGSTKPHINSPSAAAAVVVAANHWISH